MKGRVAITGATGFVGNFIANYLEARGYTVFRFGRKEQKEVLYWDITQGPYQEQIPVDYVVHSAALVDDWAAYDASFAANVVGTRHVLNSFPDSTQFIYISSASVYDAFSKQVLIAEEDCLGGTLLNNYAKTKLLGEKELEGSSIPSRVVLRPHIIYGPGDTSIAPRILSAIKFGYFPVPGNGNNCISFTHIENLAEATWQAMQLSKSGLSIYNITDETPNTLLEALNHFRRLNTLNFKAVIIPKRIALAAGSVLGFFYSLFGVKKSPLLTPYIVDQMASDHILDISKAKEELGYAPKRKVEEDFIIRP